MNILIIGGAGFIGSHFYFFLKDQGLSPIVLDDLSTGYRQFVESQDLIVGDYGDESTLSQLFSHQQFDTVVHFAARSIVSESMQNPLDYYHHNVAKTLILLTNLVKFKIKYFIFSSTAAVYGDPQYLPLDILHPTLPINPYGLSKLMVEKSLEFFSKNYDFKSISLRYFNAAGADPSGRCGECHQPETHLIPRILKAALNNTSVEVYGDQYMTRDGTCERDYIHVTDLAEAHFKALIALKQKEIESGAYNLGTGKGYTVKEVIQTVQEVTGYPLNYQILPPRLGDPPALVARPDSFFSAFYQRSNLQTIIADAWAWEQGLVKKSFLHVQSTN